MNAWVTALENAGGPWAFLGLFIVASMLMIWRLEAMSQRGMEGTVLGTVIMPYCSGMGNLVFAFLVGSRKWPGSDVVVNSVVNNVTNLTLLIGLPAMIWGLNVVPAGAIRKGKKPGGKQPGELNRLSLLLTLTAVFFFTGVLWALGRDNKIDFSDGLVLIALFLFWQSFNIFDVLRRNAGKKTWNWRLPADLLLLAVGAFAVYVSTDWLVKWVGQMDVGLISPKYMGWLSGWLMVLPNALLAFYYAWRGNPEVVYTSQIGDGHICIPLCVGICALYETIRVPALMWTGCTIIIGIALFHFLLVATLGRLPRFAGAILVVSYVVFLLLGLT